MTTYTLAYIIGIVLVIYAIYEVFTGIKAFREKKFKVLVKESPSPNLTLETFYGKRAQLLALFFVIIFILVILILSLGMMGFSYAPGYGFYKGSNCIYLCK